MFARNGLIRVYSGISGMPLYFTDKPCSLGITYRPEVVISKQLRIRIVIHDNYFHLQCHWPGIPRPIITNIMFLHCLTNELQFFTHDFGNEKVEGRMKEKSNYRNTYKMIYTKDKNDLK